MFLGMSDVMGMGGIWERITFMGFWKRITLTYGVLGKIWGKLRNLGKQEGYGIHRRGWGIRILNSPKKFPKSKGLVLIFLSLSSKKIKGFN